MPASCPPITTSPSAGRTSCEAAVAWPSKGRTSPGSRGIVWRPRRPTSSWCPSKAGWRASARPRSLRRSSASARPAASRTRPWRGWCPTIRPGVTEASVALDLEWAMRTHGADALAFDVAVPGRGPGGPAARVSWRADRRGGPRAAVRLRRAGGGVPQRHDADAVRGRARGRRPRAVPPRRRGARRRPSGSWRTRRRRGERPVRPGRRRGGPRRHRGGRPRRPLRARARPRHRPGHPRGCRR